MCGSLIEDQITGILKEHGAGVSVADLCRKHGVNDATVYKRKAKYGGMDVNEAKRLKGLERPKELARVRCRFGYRRLHWFLRREGCGRRWPYPCAALHSRHAMEPSSPRTRS